jgi:hypothetical protein
MRGSFSRTSAGTYVDEADAEPSSHTSHFDEKQFTNLSRIFASQPSGTRHDVGLGGPSPTISQPLGRRFRREPDYPVRRVPPLDSPQL